MLFVKICYNKADMQTIVIIGAGEIGTAIARLIQRPGFSVELWDRDPTKTHGQRSLSEVLPLSSTVFLCLPSWGIRSVLSSCLPLLPEDAVIVNLAKGIEKETHQTMAQVIEGILPSGMSYGILGGPMLAEELNLGMLGVGVVGTKERITFDRIRAVLDVSTLRLEWSDDPHLTALLGVLKNIYTVALGIADGLEWGSNAKGWLVALTVREMNDIVRSLHHGEQTSDGTAGIGDFIATAYSPYSRNREFGHQIVKTGAYDLKSEGCVSLPSLIALLGEQASSCKVLMALNQILYARGNAKIVFEQLIREA